MSADRRVHAAYPGMEIVRYNRAGAWYFEPTDGLPRQRVTVTDAAREAVWGWRHDGSVSFGLTGGATFDRIVLDHPEWGVRP